MAYWNDLHCSVFSPLEFKPVDRDTFDASFAMDMLGPLTVAKSYSEPATLEHTAKHVALTSERRAFLMMSVAGKIRTSHYGRHVELGVGDFLIADSAAPSRATFEEPNYALNLSLTYDTLRHYIPNPDPLFGRRISGSNGLGHTVNAMLRSLWPQIERGLPARFRPGIAKNLLEVVATAYAMEYPTELAESCTAAARRGQVKRYIESHLKDAELTTTTIAGALGLSPRYVRMVFAAEPENVSDYILRRRLEECAQQLTNVLWLGRSITDVAFEWGFSSMAHFTRAFKERFAVTPTEFKRQHARHDSNH